MTVIVVAAIGVVINVATAALFFRGRKGDLNIRAAFLHMAADALVSLGVVAAGTLYLWRSWAWIDPVMSLIVAGVVVVGTWSLFRESLHLLFDGVPEGIDLGEVRAALLALPGVRDLHELHVWGMASSQTALTAHLVLEAQHDDPDAAAAGGDTRATGTLQDPARHATTRVNELPKRRALLMDEASTIPSQPNERPACNSFLIIIRSSRRQTRKVTSPWRASGFRRFRLRRRRSSAGLATDGLPRPCSWPPSRTASC